MFIITKTFTDDEGHLFTKVNPKQYSTPGEVYDAMREDYLNELKPSLLYMNFCTTWIMSIAILVNGTIVQSFPNWQVKIG